MKSKLQIVVCKCGSVVAACIVPDCYTDSDWLRSLKKHIGKGRRVEYAEEGEFVKLENCKCNDEQLKL